VYKSFRDATDFQRELTELEVEQMGSTQVER
jgi:transcriptional regulator NrdR family protein